MSRLLLPHAPTTKSGAWDLNRAGQPATFGLQRCWLFGEHAGQFSEELVHGLDNMKFSGNPIWKPSGSPLVGTSPELNQTPKSGSFSYPYTTGPLTIEVWYYPYDSGTVASESLLMASAIDDGITWGSGSNSQFTYGAPVASHFTTGTHALNAWHQFVVSSSAAGATGTQQLYVDGATNTAVTNDGWANPTTFNRLGFSNGPEDTLNGRVGLVRIWNRVLSAGEVRGLWTKPLAMFTDGRSREVWWGFAGASGTTVNGTGTTAGRGQLTDPALLATAALSGGTAGVERTTLAPLLAALAASASTGGGSSATRTAALFAAIAASGRTPGLARVTDPTLVAALAASAQGSGAAADRPPALSAAVVRSAQAAGLALALDPALVASLSATGSTAGRATIVDPILLALTILAGSGQASGRAAVSDPTLRASLLASGATSGRAAILAGALLAQLAAQGAASGIGSAGPPSLALGLALPGGRAAGGVVLTDPIILGLRILAVSGATAGSAHSISPALAAVLGISGLGVGQSRAQLSSWLAAVTRGAQTSGQAATLAHGTSLLQVLAGVAAGQTLILPPAGVLVSGVNFRDLVLTFGRLLSGWRTLPALGGWYPSPAVPAWRFGRLTTMQISSLSLQYVRVPVSATVSGAAINPTADTVQFAFTGGGAPASGDWVAGSWEVLTGTTQYLARCLVGTGGAKALSAGTYAVWIKVSDSPEVPVALVDTLIVS